MAYAEKRIARGKTYYRACYQRPDRKAQDYVKDEDGRAVRYPTKTTAQKAADKAEVEAFEAAQKGRWIPPEQAAVARRMTLAQFAEKWMSERRLADSTMESYPHSLAHLLPTFGDQTIRDITAAMVDAWEADQLTRSAATSVRQYRSLLHHLLADAVEAGHADKNVAERRRGKGRQHGRSQRHSPEKQITTMLGSLLIAERAALLSGRDDEFVAHVHMTYTGVRWAELVGLETQFARSQTRAFEVAWQLYELESGRFTRCPPKDDSYRTIDSPAFLSRLVGHHIAQTKPSPCSCHGLTFVYSGRGASRTRQPGPTLRQVAELAKTSTGTVSNVLNRPEMVAEKTRLRVEKAIAEIGFVRQVGPAREEAAHWRRSGHATWIFTPAASGWYPKKAPNDAHPVPVSGGPWPGLPVRGRGAASRAEACWLPIKDRLTRHGLRHAHRTLMEELGTPKILMDERMGHRDGSMSARYTHVTSTMRATLMERLTEVWHESLDARLQLSPSSPVPVLDELLQERAAAS